MPPEMIAIPIMGMITGIVVIGTIAWTVVETMKSKRGAGPAPKQLASMEARLERIENAIDAMSVEVERISEGQRFTAKLLAERSGAAPQGTSAPR